MEKFFFTSAFEHSNSGSKREIFPRIHDFEIKVRKKNSAKFIFLSHFEN